MLLLLGSVLLYCIFNNIFNRLFSPEADLRYEHTLATGGLMLWAGSKLCPRWRILLAAISIGFGICSLSVFHYYQTVVFSVGFRASDAEMIMLSAKAKAALGMALFSLTSGACFLDIHRRSGGRPKIEPNGYAPASISAAH